MALHVARKHALIIHVLLCGCDIIKQMSKTRMKVAGLMFALVVAFVGGVLVSASNLGDIVSAQSNGSTTPALKISVFNQVQQPSDVDMSQFWQAWSDLQDNYVVTHPSSTLPTTQQKVYGA